MATDWTQRFWAFHTKNPHVYDELERLARQAVDAGATRIGIELLINQLRWDHLIRTKGDVFKINQNFASRYSRLLMHRNPEWDGLFERRKLRSTA